MKNFINVVNELIDNYIIAGLDIEIGGKVDEEIVAQAEQLLGLNFPLSYREFLRNFGWLNINGSVIDGLENRTYDKGVVSFTNYLREEINLPKQYIALEFDEGDLVLGIDTSEIKNKEAPIGFINPVSHNFEKINDDFKEYLIKFLTEYLEAFLDDV